jgi:large subunit ribosomal protein L15
MLLNELRPQTIQKHKKRVGRGSGSGHGKTSTRGHKGNRARSKGNNYRGFIGGQMRLMRKLPKVGFNTYKTYEHQIVNLDLISKEVKKDIQNITPAVLKEAGLIKSEHKSIKILANGSLTRAFTFEGCLFSASAKKKIEEAGGKIVLKAKN